MRAATTRGENEMSIFVRILDNDRGRPSRSLARYFLKPGFSDQDKPRMHDLVVRNQNDELTHAEKEELFVFGRAGDLLAILKSKARRALGGELRKPTSTRVKWRRI